jgi:hypothetical protein
MFKLLLETSARITRTIGDDRHACLRSEDLRTGTLKLLKRQNSGINWLVIRVGQCEDKVLDIPLIEKLSRQIRQVMVDKISFSFYCDNLAVNQKACWKLGVLMSKIPLSLKDWHCLLKQRRMMRHVEASGLKRERELNLQGLRS